MSDVLGKAADAWLAENFQSPASEAYSAFDMEQAFRAGAQAHALFRDGQAMCSCQSLLNWIEHDGGECPVAADRTVEIVTRSGCHSVMLAGSVDWLYGALIAADGCILPADAEVVRYRLITEIMSAA